MSDTTRTARQEIMAALGSLDSQRRLFALQQFDEKVGVMAHNLAAEAALRRALEKMKTEATETI